MRYFLSGIFILLTCALPQTAHTQNVSKEPICFNVRNTAPYRVYGQIASNYYTTPDGTKARHTGTFRLEKKGTNHEEGYPLDVSEFCTSGPFYSERSVELTIRTLIPIFTCKTNIELGEIVIHGRIKKDGTTKTWATCY